MNHASLLPRQIVASVVGVVLVCTAPMAMTAEESTDCQILSATQVSAIVGKPMKDDVSRNLRQEKPIQHCRFADGGIRVELSVERADSEQAAVRSYEKALRRPPGDASPDEPLHGVGIESRYRNTAKGSMIIARFGIYVVVATTNAGREAVVGLVRAAGAKVTSQ